MAHLGVLKAMVQEGVPVDFVGGTSQGAFMAAAWAATQDLDEMQSITEEFAQGMGSTWELILDMTLPIHSYFHGGKFSWAVQHCLGKDHYLEDLWTPTFVMVTNIRATSAEVRSRGKCWEMVRASMTLIGLIPPMWDKGDLLVDGGYANNLPVDVMRKLVKTGKVIAVDVENKDRSAFSDCDDLIDSEGGVSGWRLLGRKLLGTFFDVKSKWPSSQAMNEWLSFMLNNRSIEKFVQRDYIDLYILPPTISQFHLLDYHKSKVIIETGYLYALYKVQAWKAQLNQQSGGGTGKRSSSSNKRLHPAAAATGGGEGTGGGEPPNHRPVQRQHLPKSSSVLGQLHSASVPGATPTAPRQGRRAMWYEPAYEARDRHLSPRSSTGHGDL